ncbi:outer membrane protein, OMP85 family, putative [Synechococcus sp. PCC 7335]|nr:outer membrane protein, OMP85 family, putative [Synechococcus sp. PCC 7335]
MQESLPGTVEPIPVPTPAEDPIELQEEPVPASDPSSDIPTETFQVRDIQVVGNTRFENEIEALVSPLEGQEISLADLLSLRTDITNLYLEAGYLSSGAFVPNNQDLTDSTVRIQVVEGAVEQLQISGLGRLREGYVRDRINRATKTPLNIEQLEVGLQLLQTDPLLQSVDAELTAGSGPGQSLLIVELEEADPFFATLSTNNYRAPSIGSSQASAGLTHLNVLGIGDRLSVGYSFTEGLNNYQAHYTLPLNGLDGTLQLSYQNSDSDIVEELFADAGIRSESETWSVNLKQPLVRSVAQEFSLGLGLDVRESRSFILDDIPFSFSVGPEDGVSKVSVLRFSQEWVNRDIDTVLALRSQFNVGLDIFDATVNDTGTDGRFFSWLGQFQWVEQFSAGKLLLARLNAHLTGDSLLPLERFSVGGIDTVRGYAQNQLVTDNAVTFSTEMRFPIFADFQLAPFVDTGGGWNNRTANPETSFLLGTGLGLRWQPSDTINFRLDYGIPLIDAGDEGNSLQEHGLYFSINTVPF